MSFYHKQEEVLDFEIEHIYNIVANVENYPNFIKWIDKVNVLNTNGNVIDYEIFLNFKLIKEKFSTRDTFTKNEKIEIILLEGPFKYLNNVWTFTKIDENKTKVTFEINFKFKSLLLSNIFSGVFIKSQQQIFKSFIRQANKM